MKILFLLFIFSFSQCAASTGWSLTDWMTNLFASKQSQAAQAYKSQDYEQGLANFHDLMNDDPYNSEYNYNVGNILYRQKKYSDAKQAFTRAVEHAKKSSKLAEQALFNCGNSYYQLKQWQDAVTAYQNVLQINQDNESARHNLELALYQLREQQQQQPDKKSQDKNKDKSDQNQDGSQDKPSCDKSPDYAKASTDRPADKQSGENDGSDSDGQDGQNQQQGNDKNQQQKSGSQKNNGGQDKKDDNGDDSAATDKGKKQDKPGSQKNGNEGQDKNEGCKGEDSGSTDKGDEKGKNQDQKSQEKSRGQDSDEQTDMNESDKQNSDDQSSSKSSQNRLQSSYHDQHDSDGQGKDDITQQFDHTKGVNEDLQAGRDEHGKEDAMTGDDKKGMAAVPKKPELKNQLQDQYESKASDDERLTDYHKDVMKTLEELEAKVQKHIIKNKVAQQGAGQGGKNGW
ncbi:MAG: tetratricopeptide repeat protein [Candidatus Chromulinivorax sp.]|nr:tetratricopeptide repeat protein [Candidatus Chromulinivorax sp.]